VELFLNLAGVFVAVVLVGLWLRWSTREGFDRRTQIVALALLILVLFPVISVTDDLVAAQNPAETDSCVRRDYVAANVNSASPASIGLPEPRLADLPFGFLHFAAPGALPVPASASPAMKPIESRPPPAA
jgi:hypothetical protein